MTGDAASSAHSGVSVRYPSTSRLNDLMPLDGSEKALGELDTKGDGMLSFPDSAFKNASH
jgi:hypothetical protein